MTTLIWTQETSTNLIEEYRKRPELWDVSNELYRVQTAKYEAWSDLARVFQCNISDLRQKLNSIFASHRREKAKIRSGGISTWFLYPHMSFLPNHLDNARHPEETVGTTKKNDAQQSESEESDDTEESSDDNVNNEDEILIKKEPVPEIHVPEQRKTIKPPRVVHQINRSRATRFLLKRKIVKDTNTTSNSNNLDSRLLELKLLRKSNLLKKKDECDSFGEYVAISLRKHDERTQSMIKQAINNILFEQEMKKYSTGQYTFVISGEDENPLVIGDDQ